MGRAADLRSGTRPYELSDRGIRLYRKITIVGAGAIGGTVGAFLTRAGFDVTLVDQDAEHVRAMRESGLTIKGKVDFTVPVKACTPAELDGPLEAVFLCVKAMHTEVALSPVARLLAGDGFVLSLQNGLEEPKIARAVGAERTVGAFINFSADYHSPGEIMYGGPAAFVIGELTGQMSPRIRDLAEVLEVLQPIQVSDNVMGYLWGKLALASPLFATALVDSDVAEMLAQPQYRELFADCSAEVIAAADAHGITCLGFDGFDPWAMRTGRDPMATHASWLAYSRACWEAGLKKRTGIWRDLAVRKRKTEVDYQVTPALEHGEAAGVAMPLNRAIHRMIREVEEGSRTMSWSNLDELAAARRRYD